MLHSLPMVVFCEQCKIWTHRHCFVASILSHCIVLEHHDMATSESLCYTNPSSEKSFVLPQKHELHLTRGDMLQGIMRPVCWYQCWFWRLFCPSASLLFDPAEVSSQHKNKANAKQRNWFRHCWPDHEAADAALHGTSGIPRPRWLEPLHPSIAK